MDDTLEIPRPRVENIPEGDDHSSDEEGDGLDWTKIPNFRNAARPVIPKRGEKDFEPAPVGGSGLQHHVLDRSRDAMLEALRANRTISSKTISYGIWYPSIDRVHVTTARGIHFSTMGCSVSRTAQHDNANNEPQEQRQRPKLPKRLELLPEEALYLVERGALFCCTSLSEGALLIDAPNCDVHGSGAPMSVQQAFAEMIGREDLTLERYQVYAYLKRLGFIVIRADPPTPECPVAPPIPSPAVQPQTVIRRLSVLFSNLLSKIMSVTRHCHRVNWWRLQLDRHKTPQDIFRMLRFIPCGHTIPLHHPAVKPKPAFKASTASPYTVFFHAYKPSTPFRKTAPSAPDFHVVVVDARTTLMPSLQELTALFGALPEMPLPPPRKRGMPAHNKQQPDSSQSQPSDVRLNTPKTTPQQESSHRVAPSPSRSFLWTFFQRMLSFIPFLRMIPLSRETKPTSTPPKPNPFLALKTGKKTVVIAAVDAGNISFFRFGQGAFEEWPVL